MKKIILILLLLPNIAFASVVYTEYEEYLRDSEEFINSSDTLKREEYRVYNTYFEETIEKYANLEEKLDGYVVDYNDYIIKSNIALQKSIYTKNYEMKCLDEDYLINSITLDSFSNNIKINEIEIVFKDKIIPFGTKLTNNIGLSKNLFDKKIDNNYVEFSQYKGSLYLGFLKSTNLNNITLKIHFPEQDLELISFSLKIGTKYEQQVNINLEKNQSNIITIHFDNNYNNFLLENNFLINDKCITYYYEEIPLYKHTKNNINILNNYKKLNNTDLFLLDDYKIKYNYYQREKIEIQDDLFLNNEIFNIEKYIISSTIPIENLNIIHNINYNSSGTYNLEIYYKEKLIIEKPITYLKEEVKKITEEKKEEVETKEVKVSTTKKTIKKYKKTTKKKITTIKKQSKSTTKLVIKKLNNQIKLTKSNNNSKIKLIIILSSLIVALIIFEVILLYVKHKYF